MDSRKKSNTIIGFLTTTPVGNDTDEDDRDDGNAHGKDKVSLCHNGHTITVAVPAISAHILHGDTIGFCGAQ